jgi:hypothetical protein
MTEYKKLKAKEKKENIKVDKTLLSAAKSVDKMREILKNANISFVKEYKNLYK